MDHAADGRVVPTKAERLQIRVAPENVRLAKRAAALEDTTLSDFARRAIEQRAHDTLERHGVERTRITLDAEAFDAFIAACDAPPRSNEKMRAAFARARALDIE